MESLFKRHDAYLSRVPMKYIRDFMKHVNWDSRLLVIRGPKGVGKSTLMWKIQSELTPRANVSLTPENFLILTP